MELDDVLEPIKKEEGKKLIKADREKKIVLPEGVTKKTMKQFLESIKPKEDPEEKRKTGRPDDMQIAYEGNYFLMGENTLQVGENNGKLGIQSWGQQRDLGYLIFEEIWTHGRKSITELVNTIQSANKHIITLVVNQMIKDDMLLNYVEEDGIETLEIVDKRERARRQRERMALDDKTPPPDYDVEPLDPDSMI